MSILQNRAGLVAALCLALAACGIGPKAASEDTSKAELALFSTLPIYWGEGGDLAALIDEARGPDWVRAQLEYRFTLTPVDALEPEILAQYDRLLLAQPRPLAPSENVALDEWVRGGGRLLVFADPLLTRHSEFSIGDRRRPQDVVLISPILKRWGLELQFDETQPVGERWVEAYDGQFPVNLPGQFVRVEPGAPSECHVSETGVLAQCLVGDGRVTLLADAAILDWEGEGDPPPRRAGSLDNLVAAALDF
ncbi:ABC transporter [Qipengyuania sp. XHP0207]|uniref:Gldg family protein n=1 Tax=Qipengyuania sp. XHP0207 TaxID=3038078 RepID=UPI00241FEDAC|nr:ABC transporter [Qipengyuania sp. XHP0207]MDG5748981.1 ABC transporter [Qipengyuania sp. XHP0207]